MTAIFPPNNTHSVTIYPPQEVPVAPRPIFDRDDEAVTVVVLGHGQKGTYLHEQTAPAATWIIEHHMNRRPPVAVVLDGDPQEVYPDVVYVSDDVISLEFPAPCTGTAEM